MTVRDDEFIASMQAMYAEMNETYNPAEEYKKLLEEKRQNKAIITDAFFNNEISKSDYISEINALDLAEKTIKELGL